MVLTPSTMLPLGFPLPTFRLPVVSGEMARWSPGTLLGRDDLPNRPVLVMLICSHCPFVKHVEPELSRLDRDYGQRVSLLAVSSGGVRDGLIVLGVVLVSNLLLENLVEPRVMGDRLRIHPLLVLNRTIAR